jgi:Zn-dependent protease
VRDTGDGEVRVARLFGVPVLLTPSWWLGVLVVTLAYLPVVRAVLPAVDDLAGLGIAVGMTALLAGSVLVHELGHCAVALRLGLPVRRVRLFLLGGVSELARPPARPRDEALVAAAGPAVSVLVAGAAGAGALLAGGGTVEWLLAVQLAATNAVVAAFNLLPGLPLDGGRVLRAALWSATGRRGLASRGAAAGGMLVAAGLAGWGLSALGGHSPGAWLQFGVAAVTAWYVLSEALAEFARQRRRLPELSLAELVRPVLELPAESAVADALCAAAGRPVLLVRADGVAVGLLDAELAAELARRAPLAPAADAAQPVPPEAVLHDVELRGPEPRGPGLGGSELGGDPSVALDRIQASPGWQFLVVDAAGRPVGVLHRGDVHAALAEHRRR